MLEAAGAKIPPKNQRALRRLAAAVFDLNPLVPPEEKTIVEDNWVAGIANSTQAEQIIKHGEDVTVQFLSAEVAEAPAEEPSDPTSRLILGVPFIRKQIATFVTRLRGTVLVKHFTAFILGEKVETKTKNEIRESLASRVLYVPLQDWSANAPDRLSTQGWAANVCFGPLSLDSLATWPVAHGMA